MLNEIYSVFLVAGETVLYKILPITAVMGLVFALLTHWSACNPGQVWWRKREIVTFVLKLPSKSPFDLKICRL